MRTPERCRARCAILVWSMDTPRHTGLKVLFVLIWSIVVLDLLAQYLALYWVFRWFDLLVHFLGGLWVGLALLWLWYRSGYGRALSLPEGYLRPLGIALAAGLAVGLLWEAYEFIIWFLSETGVPDNFTIDSLGDLVMDILGALLAALAFVHFRRNVSTPTQ